MLNSLESSRPGDPDEELPANYYSFNCELVHNWFTPMKSEKYREPPESIWSIGNKATEHLMQ
jgi:hypothetical protein